ncbi:PD-(D/E)XK nuclease family protein [Edwardsiella ictaluri]|uniref:PD-(D/E)XK nuclease superfamily protein n=1 Tax=Edwardsiella ictaluri (strain 93-146) TaxID=634503 RepID=C5BFE9_EDWI9|nr:PD-(D/E)XK nuclease family protein [Edwardsiella ictaluri]ACR68666.1 hypothetical protein NT01EI_1480 [Edwardsiella ictaluri 93-146]EKS7764184.1 PD-(D/E)XK nuclease family protein [Edwardsiella ictaluri]EKS7771043.1 PD-(D/E)XK nuclease family protein [Edwardsiella ictaluri]EKS7774135.1 PD-(D/E)XK nuclease family protein [Edwardsiella ictaluri]EKS7777468.1 PD-(D/E)XK nuclease family protein [Edwardsiella ictaluri]
MTLLPEGLAAFLTGWQQARTPDLFPARALCPPPSPGGLNTFFTHWKQHQPLAVQHALFFDPWAVAGVARKEVPTTAVLAWLLNPQGSHGFGGIMLSALMSHLSRQSAGRIPASYGRYCHTSVEDCPTGDSRNRVDLVLDSERCYLLVEVKISAPEQEEQLQRYAQEASARAGSRAWAVLFLTPGGCAGHSQGGDDTAYLNLSWRQLSSLLVPVLDAYQGTAAHKSPQRHMAEQSAACFIRRMASL